MAGSKPVLWQIRISHYSEKARWALDYKGVEHERRAPPPGVHMLVALALTRGRHKTFPVLQLDGENDRRLDRRSSPRSRSASRAPLYPEDPEERRRALELEDWFDEELGPHDPAARLARGDARPRADGGSGGAGHSAAPPPAAGAAVSLPGPDRRPAQRYLVATAPLRCGGPALQAGGRPVRSRAPPERPRCHPAAEGQGCPLPSRRLDRLGSGAPSSGPAKASYLRVDATRFSRSRPTLDGSASR